MQATEDSDLVLQGLAILERDGIYEEGEMEGDIAIEGLDAAGANEGTSVVGGSWQGKVLRHEQTNRAVVPSYTEASHKANTCTRR